MAKKKRQGHYCKICGEIRANEKFTGKGHAAHICKFCQLLSNEEKADMSRCQDIANKMQGKEFDIFKDADIDNMPVFSEKKKFTELDTSEKTLLRDYICSQIDEHWTLSGKVLTEIELVEIKKRMIAVFEQECHIILKNDVTLRQFFHDNATSIINTLQKKTAVQKIV